MNYTCRIKVSNTTDKPQHETPRDCKHILRICWTPFFTLSQEVLVSSHTEVRQSSCLTELDASCPWGHAGWVTSTPFLCGLFPYLHLPQTPVLLPALLHTIHWPACCWGTSVLYLCCPLPRCRAGRGSLWQVGLQCQWGSFWQYQTLCGSRWSPPRHRFLPFLKYFLWNSLLFSCKPCHYLI